jgi:hypothetical protein
MPLLLGIFLWCSFSAQAQRPELRRPQDQQSAQPDTSAAKKSKRSARAIGVVEFLPGGGIRLVPVALWYEGKYYDASLYEANPSPLAVEPGTVYQALNDGEPAGTFVVNMPKLSNAGWIGDGRWTPYRAMDAQLAAEAAKHPKPTAKPSKAIFTGDADSGPPVLRRPGSEQSSSTAKAPEQTQAPAPAQASPTPAASQPATAASTTTSDSSSGRPTLRRPGDEPASAPPPTLQPVSNQPQSADDTDPDRPVLRKPASTPAPDSAAKQQPVAPSPDNNDPDRPLLTRGDQPATPQPKLSVPVSGSSPPAAKPAAKTSSSARSLAAISDAGKYETRPLVYATTPERQQELAQSLTALVLADIRSFAAKHTTGPQLPKNAAIKDYDLRFFDLDFSNSPTLVLTAKLPMPTTGSRPFVYYATYVAHLDINGEPVKVFSSVTDTTHLDVFRRLELIDALDADANGRGDLLFRQYSDVGVNYGLYRVFPYNMEKVFEGGGAL